MHQVRRRNIALFIAGVAALGGVAACSSSSSQPTGSTNSTSDSSQSASSGNANGTPISIGILAPFSGALVSVGQQIGDSAKYAASILNSHGGINGHPVNIVELDDQLDPATDVTDVTQGIAEDHVAAFVGPASSAEVNAIAPLIARFKVPDVVVGATDYTITHPAQTYIYRVASVVTNDVKADVNEGTKLGCKKAGLLTDNETVGQAYSQAITPLLPPGSVKQVFSSTTTDLNSQMQALRSGGAQCIYAATVADATLGSMVRAMANTGFKVPVISDAATTSVSFIQAAGSAALAEVPSYGTSILNVNSAFYKSTYAAYITKYGPLPQNEIGPAAFDAVNLIATALKADNEATGPALATALQSITGSDYQSVTGVAGQSLGFSATKHDWPGPDSSFLLKIEPNGDTQPTGVTAEG